MIKLDTQATEHRALAGARGTVERCRPVLLVEFWPQGIRERGEDPFAVLEDPALEGLDDRALIDKAHARPGSSGGSVTLRLDPRSA